MTVDQIAGLALAAVSLCLFYAMRRRNSDHSQEFSCQVGDQVFVGRYWVANEQVHVTCPEGMSSAPLGTEQPIHVAEQLLAEIQAVAGGRDVGATHR